ncbi:MAG TPA: FAD-dependent oxidoreductase, partial [Steroidobacteraceae bacterium]|nr:FAD-dependent oxidoreductase [Steroidobacteraceae bacterium]
GRRMRGLSGDTLASALLANGQRVVGRSLKYHRPRGIVSCGPEEPCALVEVCSSHGREPNRLATTLELHEGLEVESQNRWPSLRFDVLAVNDLFARFLPAGFYYKTFMAPGPAWERVFEPLLRRAAGLGRLNASKEARHSPAETVHDHVDVLVVGAGAAGLSAALRLGQRGMRVLLVDEDVVLGGGSVLDERWATWREAACKAIGTMASVRCLTRTAVIGAYGHGVYAALQTLTPVESARFGGLRERLRVVRAKAVILATGAIERLIAFPGNDVPGVMLAGSAHKFLRRFGVAVGRRPVFFLNTDEAYESVYAYAAAGIRCGGVIDTRSASPGAERARALGIEVVAGATIDGVRGRAGVRAVHIAQRDGHVRRKLEADCLLISGGHSPNTSLASQLGAALQWREEIAAHVATLAPAAGRMAGAARGVFGLAAAARDGESAAQMVASQLGYELGASATETSFPADPERALISAVWEVAGRGKAFVDLQNDVSCEDVRLAVREGYEHVEHMKRYTTHGMATDQGRIGGLLGSAVLAQARGLSVAEVGQAKPRPFVQPIP